MTRIVGRGFCKQCNDDVSVVVADIGIGSYEYWGAIYHDHHYIYVCADCDEEIEGEVDLYENI